MRSGSMSRYCLVQLFVFLSKWMMLWTLGTCGEEQRRCNDLSPFVPMSYCRLLAGWVASTENNLACGCHLVTCCVRANWVGTTLLHWEYKEHSNSCCVCVCLFFKTHKIRSALKSDFGICLFQKELLWQRRDSVCIFHFASHSTNTKSFSPNSGEQTNVENTLETVTIIIMRAQTYSASELRGSDRSSGAKCRDNNEE